MKEREYYLDFLRAIGIMLIILAHVNAPIQILQIRCFDVPLMIFVSGLAFSGKIINADWHSFYKPRVKRLVIPSLTFAVLYLILLLSNGENLSLDYVINTLLFLHTNSIGYLWIIRVFVLIMLVTPILSFVNKKLSNAQFIFLILVLIIIQELLVDLTYQPDSTEFWNVQYMESILYMIGYSIIFLYGLKLRYNSSKKFLLFSSILFLICIIGIYVRYKLGMKITISAYFKYPPRFYYIAYGLFVCTCLWYLRNILGRFIKLNFLRFIGQNTMWIYLWHIVMVYFTEFLDLNFIYRYIIVFSSTLIIYLLQYNLVSKNLPKYKFLRYFIG